jgi:uncharacterized protein YkwD
MACHRRWLALALALVLVVTTGIASAAERKFKDILNENWNYSCLSAKEAELLRLVNEYRESQGLAPIPNSSSLNRVARFHAIDLSENNPANGRDSRGNDCNMHSWSNKGPWTPVCYTNDHRYADLMRSKPQEISHNVYSGPGYENAYWTTESEVSPQRVLERWKKSPAHNDVILERGGWQRSNLLALGVGIYRNVAVIWVGTMIDPLGPMATCRPGRESQHYQH